MAYLRFNNIVNAFTVILFFQSVICRPTIPLSKKLTDRALSTLLTSVGTISMDSTKSGRTSRQSDFLAHDQPSKKSNSIGDAASLYDTFLVLNGVKPGSVIPPDFVPDIKPSGTFQYSLICKNGYLLSISKDGKIHGGLQRNASTVFDFEVYGKGLVTIWSAINQSYLAMGSDGHLKTVKTRTIETFFTHRVLLSLYRTFQSLYYRQSRWHIGIRKNGNLKRGRPSNGKTQTAYQFIIMNIKK